jgi:hypothetical protein
MSAPSEKLNIALIDWGENERIYRVHSQNYGAAEFNTTARGEARFSPLLSSAGTVVPTLYAGSTLDCALMETVFHDVPFARGPKLHSKAKHIAGKFRSTLRLTRDVRLINLRAIPLRKLGISPTDLIVTDSSHYTETRSWAAALYQQCQEAEGLLWTSRQDDSATAIMLFGDRLPSSPIEIVASPLPLLLEDGAACDEVLNLAARLDVLLI